MTAVTAPVSDLPDFFLRVGIASVLSEISGFPAGGGDEGGYFHGILPYA